MGEVLVGRFYRHLNGNFYEVLYIANQNLDREDPEFPEMVVYRDEGTRKVYARKPEHFMRKMKLQVRVGL